MAAAHSVRDYLPEFDAVFVVSDLHLGGYADDEGRDYRIFQESSALSWFIGSLSQRLEAKQRVCLVLNGDIIDFLAHKQPKYFDWVHALDKLEDALTDPEQSSVWQALQRYVTDGGHLVLVLGNHDLELALPDPQQRLLHFLSDGRSELRGQIELALDGAGFRCRVKRERVLCVHGNEGDPWNAIDYGRLSLIRRALARGSMDRNATILSSWIPNPGTQLVIDYLNGLKHRYQWIDLLKPEEEATAMVSAALCDLPRLRVFAEVMANKAENAKRLADGFMAGTYASAAGPSASAAHRGDTRQLDADASILAAVEALSSGQRPQDMVDDVDAPFLMDPIELTRRTIALKLWPRGLREALEQTIADDRWFEIERRDEVARELDELVGPDVEFLVAGHTHLQRAFERDRFPGKYYFNSGTWIRLLRIRKELLARDLFPEIEYRLRDGRLSELQKPLLGATGVTSLLQTTRTVVCIEHQQDKVHAELRTVEEQSGAPAMDRWRLVPVPGSRFPREKVKP